MKEKKFLNLKEIKDWIEEEVSKFDEVFEGEEEEEEGEEEGEFDGTRF